MSDPSPIIPTPLPLLRYANPAQQFGLIVEKSPGAVRITIPKRFLKFLAPIIIDLDATRLLFVGVTNEWVPDDSLERPRSAIYELKFVPHTGNLFIKAHGFSFFECRPHRDSKIVEWIANELNDALQTP